jgi:hypothetical protein
MWMSNIKGLTMRMPAKAATRPLALFGRLERRFKMKNKLAATSPTVKTTGTSPNQRGPHTNEAQASRPKKSAAMRQASPVMTFKVLIRCDACRAA